MNVSKYIYNTETGALLHRYVGPESQLDVNVPPGCSTIEADLVIDANSQRVDLETQKVVDWQPPRPDENHYWDSGARRWLINPIVAETQRRRADLIQRIKELDERLIRPMAELFENPNDGAAREIYSKLKTEKDTLRTELKALSGP